MFRFIYKFSAFLLLIFSVNAYSESKSYSYDVKPKSGFYLGLNLAKSVTGKVTAEVNDDEISNDLDASSKGIYVGYRTQSNNRIQLSRTSISIDYDGGGSNDISGTELDFHYVYGKEKVHPYIGFGFGLHSLEDSEDDLDGVSFQLLGGIKFDVHEHVELDLSFHVKSIVWEEIVVYDGYYGFENIQVTHSYSALNFGAAYMF